MSVSAGIVADIGGTNARFALATVAEDGIRLDHVRTLPTRDYPTFEAAFEDYRAGLDVVPDAAVFAVATPVGAEELKFTNSPWTLRPALLPDRLRLASVRIINDFEAIARAVPALAPRAMRGFGGAFALPETGVISIVGPGSGLGVGMLARGPHGDQVLPCEGGHVGVAPADPIDAYILEFVAERYPRVSAERLLSGPGLVQIFIALAAFEQRAIVPPDPITLWQAAITGDDIAVRAAFERWLMMLGTFAGDIVLAQGGAALLFAGGILPRFGPDLDVTGLLSRFRAKGRFEALMHRIPIALITDPEPGLLGAATVLRDPV